MSQNQQLRATRSEGKVRNLDMGKRGHSEEKILRVLREAESGDTVVEICRKHGISQQTLHELSWNDLDCMSGSLQLACQPL